MIIALATGKWVIIVIIYYLAAPCCSFAVCLAKTVIQSLMVNIV